MEDFFLNKQQSTNGCYLGQKKTHRVVTNDDVCSKGTTWSAALLAEFRPNEFRMWTRVITSCVIQLDIRQTSLYNKFIAVIVLIICLQF